MTFFVKSPFAYLFDISVLYSIGKPYTLIRDQYPFPLAPQSQKWFLKLLGFEALREHTIELMQGLQQQNEIWIYTSSMRDLFYLRLLFRWQGIFLGGVVNLTVHEQHVKMRCTKYPPAFGIDLLIDDARGVNSYQLSVISYQLSKQSYS